MPTTEARRWRLKGPEMEGPIARWYARIRGSQSQLDSYEKQAALITAGLSSGARVLEVAPGPGYEQGRISRRHRPRGGRDEPRMAQRLHDESNAGDAQASRVRTDPVRAPRLAESIRDM